MNYSLKQINDKTFLIDARIRIEGVNYRKRERFSGSRRQANFRGRDIVEALQAEAEREQSMSSLKTFSECISFYVKEKSPASSDITYINRLDKELGSVLIEDLPKALIRFVAYLNNSVNRLGKKYSNASKNRYQQWTRAIINYCHDWEQIEEKPKLKFKKFEEQARDVSLTPEDIERLFRAIDEYRPYLRPITMYSIQVPSRVSELTETTIFNCDLKENLIRFKNGTTKNGDGGFKPIPPNMVEYFNSIPKGCPWVFYREDNGDYKKLKNFNRAWRLVCDKAGLPNLHFHDLRGYSVTELVKKGMSEREVMDICFWKNNMLHVYYKRNGIGSSNKAFELLKNETDSDQKKEKLG